MLNWLDISKKSFCCNCFFFFYLSIIDIRMVANHAMQLSSLLCNIIKKSGYIMKLMNYIM